MADGVLTGLFDDLLALEHDIAITALGFVDNGVIFFEEKVRSIPVWLFKIKLRLIALNSELQVFHAFLDDNVFDPQVLQCVD
ncbi:hypothetical protein Tco_0986801 [Tanacetum coccineum]